MIFTFIFLFFNKVTINHCGLSMLLRLFSHVICKNPSTNSTRNRIASNQREENLKSETKDYPLAPLIVPFGSAQGTAPASV